MPLHVFTGQDQSSGDGGGAALATGTYAGDGTNDRVIVTGLSQPPRQIFIVDPDNSTGVGLASLKTADMPAKVAAILATGNVVATFGAPVAIVGNDFTVDGNIFGAASVVNASGRTYFWTALA